VDKNQIKTMSIQLNKPYRIIRWKEKRSNAHYQIPSAKVVVIPLKKLDTEVLCDVRWENDNGEMKVLHDLMFIGDNLIPLNEMIDEKLFEVWKHYYSPSLN
jgi:hypothetical protein